ncbi:GGDEF domain-containing protein [Paenibacillus agricola]|uniref:GGDEF domain-containing protein n=1 Tax=Paenibacillus agricola TaxID=2716264 RepID=A0ABX0JAR5_9BACL|nr:GGDEF domain-containing protein [Paenibacillus agricola]NHN33494.1 GGDEF domain-containing protein [Paenibacillus agricola]
MSLIAFTNACILIAISYVALKLKNRLFMERFELWSAPLLTGVACIIMMMQPHTVNGFAAVFYGVPVIMAGLRFGGIVAILSTLLPALYMYQFTESPTLLQIVQDLMAPAIASSLFHRKESASGYVNIPFLDGLKLCMLLGSVRILYNGYMQAGAALALYIDELFLFIIFTLVVTILIAMYNDDNRSLNLQRRLELQANQDGLTGLPNLRSFMTIAQNTVKLRPLSIMMIDIDNFKRFNDTYGHMQGDRLLCEVGQILRTTINEHDYAARYGGEEFIVLSHITDDVELSVYAQKLCKAVESHRSSSLEETNITISIGISISIRPQIDLLRIISEADEALYSSKHNGKNRSTLYSSMPLITSKNA